MNFANRINNMIPRVRFDDKVVREANLANLFAEDIEDQEDAEWRFIPQVEE